MKEQIIDDNVIITTLYHKRKITLDPICNNCLHDTIDLVKEFCPEFKISIKRYSDELFKVKIKVPFFN